MKKLILTAALASAVMFVNAQTMTSKNGTPILPEAGDWSIGVDAQPVLNYFGNMFNNTSNNSVSINGLDQNAIVGKYMKDANTAYRLRAGINFGSGSVTPGTLNDSLNDPSKITTSGTNITLGAGIQKFRGKGRLQGIYGAEALISFGSGKTTNEFAKSFDSNNQTQVNRITEVKNGSTFNFGVRAFLGAEYFFAPKMSLGIEYGWGLSLGSTGASETTTEAYDGTSNSVTTTTTKGGKASNFGLNVQQPDGSIVLSLYF